VKTNWLLQSRQVSNLSANINETSPQTQAGGKATISLWRCPSEDVITDRASMGS